MIWCCASGNDGFPAVKKTRRLGNRRSLIVPLLFLGVTCACANPIIIGSKKFTESYVLGEIAGRTLTEAGIPAEHRQGMGGTIILWQALSGGQRRSKALRLDLRTISDLRNHPELKVGLTHEFLDRRDGWQPLRARYNLPQQNVVGIDHALGYAALANGSIDVKDAYSTDAKISENDLITLEDDLQFFPRYNAVFLYRLSLPASTITALRRLEGTLDETRMIRLNAEAERTKNYARAANLFFEGSRSSVIAFGETFFHKLKRWTLRHLELAGASLSLSVLVGVPLGILASRGGPIGQAILGFTGVVQTIPSLALLALLVPLPFFGISVRTAVAALFLYGLLPIVRNTASGLQDIPRALRESAIALGLRPTARLWQIYLPMASRSILSGIKTSAVINIGTATLAALIGAGGLGEPILSGLNLNDHVTILEGAIPAALLALLVQWLFDLLDRILIPKGLRV